MGLLSGVKIVSKDGKKARTVGGQPPPPKSKPVAQPETEAAPDPEELKRQQVEREIQQGLREPSSGRLYGLHDPKAGATSGLRAASLPRVGDGGASWKKAALKRARETAEKRGGASLAAVVEERWGSVTELKDGSRGADDQERWDRRRGMYAGKSSKREGGGGWVGNKERGGRVRLGRDARDTDVLKRFSSKIRDAMAGHQELAEKGSRADTRKRDRDRDGDGGKGRRDENGGRKRRRSKFDEEWGAERSGDEEDGREHGDGRMDAEKRKKSKRDKDERRRKEESRRMEEYEEVGVQSGAKEKGESKRLGRDSEKETRETDRKDIGQSGSKADEKVQKWEKQEGKVEAAGAAAAAVAEVPAVVNKPVSDATPAAAASLGGLLKGAVVASPAEPAEDASAAEPGPPSSMAGLDLNALAAQALKAKMRGKKAEYARLTAKLEAAKSFEGVGGENGPEVVQLLDRRGRPMQGKAQLSREDLRANPNRRGKLKESKAAQRGREEELAEYLKRERETGEEDMDEVFVHNVMRLGNRFKGSELGGVRVEERDEAEGGGEVDMKMFQRPEDRMTEVRAAERARQQAVAEHRKQAASIAKCRYCMEAPGFKHSKVIAMGQHAFLYLMEPHMRLCRGHVAIVPVAHVKATTACDEEVWAEIEQFKASLRGMAAQSGKHIIFLETAYKFGKRPHASIEAIPVIREVEMDAPLYFKAAMSEAGEDWGVHKRVIPLKTEGIRRSVPKDFAYFMCEWNGGGYAHIIESDSAFSATFGIDTVAGIMGVDPPKFNRSKAGGPDGKEQQVEVLAFKESYKPHDWTTGAVVEG